MTLGIQGRYMDRQESKSFSKMSTFISFENAPIKTEKSAKFD